jgi:hypothetical protein
MDIDVFISTYETQYTNELINMYNGYIAGVNIYNHQTRIGIKSLFHNSMKNIKHNDQYDFIFYIRIDLHLKDYFSNIFDPDWKTIHFVSALTEAIDYYKKGHPRVNDMMLFFPKKYFDYIQYFGNSDDNCMDQHSQWGKFIDECKLTYHDLDTMLDTYRDSNTIKQGNPIYFLANRPITDNDHAKGHIFDKNKWYE